MKAKDIIKSMEKWAKKDLIDSWDNTGFQVGDWEKDVKKILLSLDLDRLALDRAIEANVDMIISHHPLIFQGLKRIRQDDYKGRMILDIIKNDILVYNAHSNLDLADSGVNDQLAKLLNLENKDILKLAKILDKDGISNTYGYGRIGQVQSLHLEDLVEKIKDKLDIDSLIVYGRTDRMVNRLALCGGSGSEFIQDAFEKGADVYMTGDIKYHEAQLAHELGITIIDPGHYHSEKIILPVIKDYLHRELGGEVEIEVLLQSGLAKKIY